MHKLRLFSAMMFSIAIAGPAWAESAFFVQLGSATSEQEANSKWKDLQSKYPALLEELKYAPRTVTPVGGGESEFRVQAGPAKNREAARHICSVLMAKDVECFIVETAVFEGEASYPRVTTSEEPVQPPAETNAESGATAAEEKPASAEASPAPAEASATIESPPAETAAAVPPVEIKKITTSGQLPWLSKKEEAAAAPKPPVEASQETPPETPEPKGHVDVAEAIPVPLSMDTGTGEVKEEQKEVPAPPLKAGESVAAAPVPDVEWVEIAGFTTEQDAYRFFESLQTHLNDHGTLKVRITQPMHLRHQSAQAELDIGPVQPTRVADICYFASGYDARLRCGHDGVLMAGSQLPVEQVHVSNLPPVASIGEPGTPRPRRMVTTSYSSTAVYPSVPASQFYAQLGAWPSKAEATRRWDELKQEYPNVLADYTPDIRPPARASLNAKPSVRLRVGPFSERGTAEDFCSKLGKHGVKCLVVPE